MPPSAIGCSMSNRSQIGVRIMNSSTTSLPRVCCPAGLLVRADEVLAHRIIELAKAGERDPDRLCDDVLKEFPCAAACVTGPLRFQPGSENGNIARSHFMEQRRHAQN